MNVSHRMTDKWNVLIFDIIEVTMPTGTAAYRKRYISRLKRLKNYSKNINGAKCV